MFFLFQSCHNPTTLRVQLQALRAEKKVPGDLLGRCPLPSCRPGNCRSTKGWWMDRMDHDEKGGENHTNHTETRVNIWFNKITKGNLYTSGEIVPLHMIFLAVKSVSEEVQRMQKPIPNEPFSKACMLHYCFAQHLLVRGTTLNNFIFYIFLDLLALLCWHFGTRKRPRPVHASWSLNSLRHKPLDLSSKRTSEKKTW